VLHPDGQGRAQTPKAFYVSPMFTVDGRYLVRFRLEQERVSVVFVLRRGDAGQHEGEHTALTAWLSGTAQWAGRPRAGTILRCALSAQRTIALIHYESLRLRRLGLPLRRRRTHREQPGVGAAPSQSQEKRPRKWGAQA
jgi:DUF1365 family protein